MVICGTFNDGEGETVDDWSLARYAELVKLLIKGAPCRGADILTIEVFVTLLNRVFGPGAVTTMFLLAVTCEGIPS